MTTPSPITFYVATSNPGKLRDFETAARARKSLIRLLPLPGLDGIPAPAENGATFEENATAKAIAYSRHAPGKMVLADDSGLEVDALDGAPGVHSARYATLAGLDPAPRTRPVSDERNNRFLIKNLRDVSTNERTARYRCVLALARDGQRLALGCGAVEGMILEAPRGTGGFGYDPLFFLPELGRTMAEITLEEKLPISHRGRALGDLIDVFRTEVDSKLVHP